MINFWPKKDEYTTKYKFEFSYQRDKKGKQCLALANSCQFSNILITKIKYKKKKKKN